MNAPQPPPDAYVTTTGRCSRCYAKLANAETSRLAYQGEAFELSKRIEPLTKALHDIFELASNQKSNRGCATDEGLIATALAAVRVIRKVCDEQKAKLAAAEQRAINAEARISHFIDDINAAEQRVKELEIECRDLVEQRDSIRADSRAGMVHESKLSAAIERERVLREALESADRYLTVLGLTQSHAVARIIKDALAATGKEGEK